MIYILDTDHLSLLGHKDSPEAPRIRRRIAELPADDSVVTTVINFEEQMRGWMATLRTAKSFRAEVQVYTRLLAHLATFRQMTILEFDAVAADICLQLRAHGLRIGVMDMKIAAIALVFNATVVTRNVADFRRVPHLSLEDWSANGAG